MQKFFGGTRKLLIAGIIMIPFPGPGWLVVFVGLGILATEFVWAQRVLDHAKSKYDAWQKWLRQQRFAIQALVWLATCVIVIVTIWLINGYGMINSWLHLGQDWLASPFFRK
jgi:uncharacterized protein (TIGR02611 family)